MSEMADARLRPIGDGSDMTYVQIIQNTEADMAKFRDVEAALDVKEPDGLLARYVGEDGGLAIVTVWDSKAHSDRFFAEHLGSALRAVIGDAPPPADHDRVSTRRTSSSRREHDPPCPWASACVACASRLRWRGVVRHPGGRLRPGRLARPRQRRRPRRLLPFPRHPVTFTSPRCRCRRHRRAR